MMLELIVHFSSPLSISPAETLNVALSSVDSTCACLKLTHYELLAEPENTLQLEDEAIQNISCTTFFYVFEKKRREQGVFLQSSYQVFFFFLTFHLFSKRAKEKADKICHHTACLSKHFFFTPNYHFII